MILLKGIIMFPYRRTLQNLHLELVVDNADRRSHIKAQRDSNSAFDGMDCIGTLGSLKTLSLRFEAQDDLDDRNEFIDSACYALTYLHRLESFIIYEGGSAFDDAPDVDVSSRLAHAHPPSSLKSLCFDVEHPKPRILSWLTTPRVGYQLDRMSLFPSAQGRDSELSAIRPAVPFLKAFSVNASCYMTAYLTAKHNKEGGVTFLMFTETIRQALSIDTLVLRFDSDISLYELKMLDISSLPPALQRLSLLLYMRVGSEADYGTYNAELDEAISRFALTVNHEGCLRVIIEHHVWCVNPVSQSRSSSRSR